MSNPNLYITSYTLHSYNIKSLLSGKVYKKMKRLKNEHINLCILHVFGILIFAALFITEGRPAVIVREKYLPVEIYNTDEEASQRVRNLVAMELEKEDRKKDLNLSEEDTDLIKTENTSKQEFPCEKKLHQDIVKEDQKQEENRHMNTSYIASDSNYDKKSSIFQGHEANSLIKDKTSEPDENSNINTKKLEEYVSKNNLYHMFDKGKSEPIILIPTKTNNDYVQETAIEPPIHHNEHKETHDQIFDLSKLEEPGDSSSKDFTNPKELQDNTNNTEFVFLNEDENQQNNGLSKMVTSTELNQSIKQNQNLSDANQNVEVENDKSKITDNPDTLKSEKDENDESSISVQNHEDISGKYDENILKENLERNDTELYFTDNKKREAQFSSISDDEDSFQSEIPQESLMSDLVNIDETGQSLVDKNSDGDINESNLTDSNNLWPLVDVVDTANDVNKQYNLAPGVLMLSDDILEKREISKPYHAYTIENTANDTFVGEDSTSENETAENEPIKETIVEEENQGELKSKIENENEEQKNTHGNEESNFQNEINGLILAEDESSDNVNSENEQTSDCDNNNSQQQFPTETDKMSQQNLMQIDSIKNNISNGEEKTEEGLAPLELKSDLSRETEQQNNENMETDLGNLNRQARAISEKYFTSELDNEKDDDTESQILAGIFDNKEQFSPSLNDDLDQTLQKLNYSFRGVRAAEQKIDNNNQNDIDNLIGLESEKMERKEYVDDQWNKQQSENEDIVNEEYGTKQRRDLMKESKQNNPSEDVGKKLMEILAAVNKIIKMNSNDEKIKQQYPNNMQKNLPAMTMKDMISMQSNLRYLKQNALGNLNFNHVDPENVHRLSDLLQIVSNLLERDNKGPTFEEILPPHHVDVSGDNGVHLQEMCIEPTYSLLRKREVSTKDLSLDKGKNNRYSDPIFNEEKKSQQTRGIRYLPQTFSGLSQSPKTFNHFYDIIQPQNFQESKARTFYET